MSNGRARTTTSLPLDFPASLTVLPEGASVKTTPVVSGTKSFAAFGVYDPDTHSLKTSRERSLQTVETSSQRCYQTWPQQGMMLSGILFQLPTLARPTLASAFGSWPTPRASEYKDCGPKGSKSQIYMSKKSYLCGRVKDFEPDGTNGKLNPTWVTWLMGFPINWLAPSKLEALNEAFRSLAWWNTTKDARSASKPSEMQSSLR